MPLNFDSALGPFPRALQIRARRTELLAANLANADTPNFKARDIDFRAAMSQARAGQMNLKTTQPGHISTTQADSIQGAPVQFRVPQQPSLDGNTVDAEKEKTAFAENAVKYQATMTFLSRKFSGLKGALKGD